MKRRRGLPSSSDFEKKDREKKTTTAKKRSFHSSEFSHGRENVASSRVSMQQILFSLFLSLRHGADSFSLVYTSAGMPKAEHKMVCNKKE